MKNQRNKGIRKTAIILGSAIIAAAWLISGPEVLLKFGVSGNANDLLVWLPAMIVFCASIASDKKAMACERRAFKRLLGR